MLLARELSLVAAAGQKPAMVPASAFAQKAVRALPETVPLGQAQASEMPVLAASTLLLQWTAKTLENFGTPNPQSETVQASA